MARPEAGIPDRETLRPLVRASEQIVLAPESHTSELPLDFPIIDLESTIGEAAPPPLLLSECILRRLVERCLGHQPWVEILDPLVQLVHLGERLRLAPRLPLCGRQLLLLAGLLDTIEHL